jgi:hypothetical protein
MPRKNCRRNIWYFPSQDEKSGANYAKSGTLVPKTPLGCNTYLRSKETRIVARFTLYPYCANSPYYSLQKRPPFCFWNWRELRAIIEVKENIMRYVRFRSRFLTPALFLLLGLCLGGFFPHTPLHSVATDRSETFLVATGMVDESVEAIYMLDCLTGDLRAAVPGKSRGGFTGMFSYGAAHAGFRTRSE